MGNLTVLHIGLRKFSFYPEQIEFAAWGIKIRKSEKHPWTRMIPWHRIKLVTVVPRGY